MGCTEVGVKELGGSRGTSVNSDVLILSDFHKILILTIFYIVRSRN
jgi:hypothetical protein